jgi:two-component system, OmpR family, sensor kinase
MRRAGIRTRLLIASAAAVAVALTVLVGGFNLVLRHELNAAATDRARTRAVAELSGLDTTGGRLRAPETPDAAAVDVPIWIFSGATPVEQPRVGETLSGAAASLVTSGHTTVDVPGEATRLYAVPVTAHGRRLGTVVAAVSLEPYRSTERAALLLSALAGVMLLVVMVLASRWILGRALAPVSEMTSAAAIWSEHDVERRFAAGEPHDEIGRLAATLDGLLDRISGALHREQLFTAEISHELRTPLARIRAEADLSLRRDREPAEYRQALETISRNSQQLTRIVDTLLDAARAKAGQNAGSSNALEVARQAVAACASLGYEHDLAIALEGNGGLVAVDGQFAVRVLQPLIENACRYGNQKATIAVTLDGAAVRFNVRDDGDGVPPDEGDAIFEPGARGRGAAQHNETGAGLGLALARRLARSVGGEITVHPGPGGHFVLRLPAVTGP